MIIEFPHVSRRIPLDEAEDKLAEQERLLETELKEVRDARESIRAIRAANSTKDSIS